MAKRSPRIPEQREKNELSCTWGLFSILQSCQGLTTPKLISDGRSLNRHVTGGYSESNFEISDHPRKPDQLTSFDKECRKIRREVAVARVTFNESTPNAGNLTGEDLPTEKHKSKQHCTKMDSKLVDGLAKTEKRVRKNSQKAYQSSSSRLNDAAGQAHQPSTSAETSLTKLTLAALIEAVSSENHPEEDSLSDCFQRGDHPGKNGQADQISMEQVQMSAKAFVDQMFIEREMIRRQGTNSDSKSFSNALEVLRSNKHMFTDLLPDPNSMLSRRIKKLDPRQTEKETIKSLLDAKFSEYRSQDASTPAKPGCALATPKGKMNKHLWPTFDYQCLCTPQTRSVAQPSDKIAVLKPARKQARNFEHATCHCSSVQSHRKLSRRAPDAKSTPFSFRENKKKPKHTFGGNREEPSQISMNGIPDALACSKSTTKVGDDCIHCGADTKNSFSSSTNADTNRNQCKKQERISNRDSDIACVNDTVRKKLDYSGAAKNQEFDVILEAKKHLSERLKNLNEVEPVRNKKSTRTLRRILESPEHDLWPLSPRSGSQYFSGSAQMRSSPYNTSPRINETSSQLPNGRESACQPPLRPNAKVTSRGDDEKHDDMKTSFQIPSTDAETPETEISATETKEPNGKPNVVEKNGNLGPELHISIVSSETNITNVTRTALTADTSELLKNDESIVHSISDSLSENEAFASTVDDIQSTPSSACQLDLADSVKYQEKRQSPVSVLEPFFIEEDAIQTDRQSLQPLRLDFEEHSFESYPHDPPISAGSYIDEQDHLSEYVHMVMQASCLDWDQLSDMRSPPEKLLHASLFNEVELPAIDCCFDPKLLFDHINEVLLEIHQSHFCSRPWVASIKPKITSVPLAELVLDEIMREVDFYLLPRTEKRTLDQLVTKDVACCRSWLDVRLDTEQIAIDISEDFLEECMQDILLESFT